METSLAEVPPSEPKTSPVEAQPAGVPSEPKPVILAEVRGNQSSSSFSKKMEVPRRFQPKRLVTDPKPVFATLPTLEQPTMI